jgi:hypothetical protein
MKLSAMLLSAALAAAASAGAQTPDNAAPPSADVKAARTAMLKACATDINSNCVDKERRELMMCLRSNIDKLSPACKDAMSNLQKAVRAARPAAPAQ